MTFTKITIEAVIDADIQKLAVIVGRPNRIEQPDKTK